MKKLSPLIILSILLLSGCGAFGGGGTNDQANITPTPPPQPTPEAENQEKEVVNEENTATAEVNNVPNALIPSTNPQERLNQITQGRGDPFGSIRPPAVVRIPVTQPVPESAVAKAILRDSTMTTATATTTPTANGVVITRNQSGRNKDINGNVTNFTTLKGAEPNSLCEIPSPEMIVRKPKIGVSGIITNYQGYMNVALITIEDESAVRTVREGDIIYSGGNSLLVKQINSYNLVSQIASASRSRTVDLSGGTLSGEVVFELKDGSFMVQRVGDKISADKGGENQQAFQLNLKKEQFNIVNREKDGLTLIALEDVVPKLVNIGSDIPEAPKEVIEISGYVCNNTNQTIQVTEIAFALSSGNTELPPLTAFFQGLEQGDIAGTGGGGTKKQARLIRPGKVTLFRGSVANVPAFQTQDQIDMSLEEWR